MVFESEIQINEYYFGTLNVKKLFFVDYWPG